MHALNRAAALLALALMGGAAWATPAGTVEFARGVGFAQAPGQTPRVLGKGLAVEEGDRLTTAEGATAIVKLTDGTRMTLRSNSDLVIEQHRYQPEGKDNSLIMSLLRGGFRAITGLINKNAPNAARVKTANATLGIRGTDFDARLCGADCRAEAGQITQAARPNHVVASAKLVNAAGSISATGLDGQARALVTGGAVYAGDVVRGGPDAQGVLVFRDESRVTLGPRTEFKVDAFVYDDKNPREGNFLLSLVRGSLRALTGLIGKAAPRNVGFRTANATIGIRGTGLDMDCGGGGACNFYTWQGVIEVRPLAAPPNAPPIELAVGRGLMVTRTAVTPITQPPLEQLQRPDTVPVNTKQLFSAGDAKPNEDGLYVFVREGHVEVASAKETLHLGRGETGLARVNGEVGRPAAMPLFIQFDRTPMPNHPNPMLVTVMGEVAKTTSNQCR